MQPFDVGFLCPLTPTILHLFYFEFLFLQPLAGKRKSRGTKKRNKKNNIPGGNRYRLTNKRICTGHGTETQQIRQKKFKYPLHNHGCNKHCHEVNAKILSAIFVRHIGHSEQASEQGLHKQKCRQGRRIAAVGDS